MQVFNKSKILFLLEMIEVVESFSTLAVITREIFKPIEYKYTFS